MQSDRKVLFWLAALIIAVIAVLVLKDVLLPFVAGLVIAYALNPVTEKLGAMGLSRTLASAVVVALLVISLALALVFVVPVLLAQLQQFAVALPGQLDKLRELAEDFAKARLGEHFPDIKASLDQAMKSSSVNWGAIAAQIVNSVWAQSRSLASLVSLLLITPLVVFYMLVDWHPMLKKVDSWLPRDHAATIRRLAGEIDHAIAAFIRGQGLVCLALALFYAVGLSWAGVHYGLLIGLVTGILSFVPFAGWALGVIVASLTALAQAWPDMMPLYKVLGVLAAGMALDSAMLSPNIVGKSIGLHPVWLIFALFVFSYLFGFVGVMVAVPLAAAIAVLIRYAIRVYLDSDLYHGRGKPVADGSRKGPSGGGLSP